MLRRISWFLVLIALVIPVQAFAQNAPAAGSGRSLMPLYVSYAALQAVDIHSTMRALDRGAVEANPLMTGVARQPAALIGVKAAGAASTIWLAHKMSKRSRIGAFAVMTAANSAYAMVVAHNYRTAR